MITGINPRIEKEMTVEPKDYVKYAKIIAKGLNNHIGKACAITADKIAEGLKKFKDEFDDITSIKVRSIIKHMRHRGYVPCILSLGRGYWIAESPEEGIETLQFFHDKINAEIYTFTQLKEQLEERFGCKIEVIEPEEAEEENDYRTVFLS